MKERYGNLNIVRKSPRRSLNEDTKSRLRRRMQKCGKKQNFQPRSRAISSYRILGWEAKEQVLPRIKLGMQRGAVYTLTKRRRSYL